MERKKKIKEEEFQRFLQKNLLLEVFFLKLHLAGLDDAEKRRRKNRFPSEQIHDFNKLYIW